MELGVRGTLGKGECPTAVNGVEVVEPPSWAAAAVSISVAAWIFFSPSAEAGGAVTPGMKKDFECVARAAPLH